MSEAKPYSKSAQLARGTRKYRRFVASGKQWQVLAQTKNGPCRVCLTSASNGRVFSKIQLHHVVSRAQGGDDYAANLVPVCPDCHRLLHNREPGACRALCASLLDSEYAYCVQKCGESFFERAYGFSAPIRLVEPCDDIAYAQGCKCPLCVAVEQRRAVAFLREKGLPRIVSHAEHREGDDERG